ncbi:MAG: 4Fe-4S binding protein [Acidobacteriota bacterium]|nr:4Fe-4S binding protein [Acidobacteriota bacterium]
MDLLRPKFIRGLASSRAYPLAAQIFTLISFGLLVAGGLVVPHVSEKMAGTLRNTNLAALIVWSLWWPLVLISATVLGRVWCKVCPMELVNSFFGKIGLRRRAPRFFTSGWGITVFYSLALLGFIRTFWAHRYPERMSAFFLFLFATAIVTGLIYEKRAFCDYLCPVGRLLGLYACCSILEWRVKDKEICENCRTKDCVDPSRAYTLTARSCTSHLYPPRIKDNRRCLVCTHCIKVCPYKNLRHSVRKPMADLFGSIRLSTAEFFLLFLASGLAIWEISEEWSVSEQALLYLPDLITSWLGASGEWGHLIHALVLFVGLPAVLFLLPGLTGKYLNRISLLDSLKTFGLIFLPVVALTHMLKGLFRITSRLPYYHLAIKDPAGLETAKNLIAGNISLSDRLPSLIDPYLSVAALLIFGGALATVVLVGMKNPTFKSLNRAGRIPYVAAAVLYCSVLIIATFFARF